MGLGVGDCPPEAMLDPGPCLTPTLSSRKAGQLVGVWGSGSEVRSPSGTARWAGDGWREQLCRQVEERREVWDQSCGALRVSGVQCAPVCPELGVRCPCVCVHARAQQPEGTERRGRQILEDKESTFGGAAAATAPQGSPRGGLVGGLGCLDWWGGLLLSTTPVWPLWSLPHPLLLSPGLPFQLRRIFHATVLKKGTHLSHPASGRWAGLEPKLPS
jgi:hypothetical protein